MFTSQVVINNHPYYDTSSSSTSSYSSVDISQEEECIRFKKKSNRKQRTFIPDTKKDPIYWSQRSRNNLSAKRSRVKRRMNDMVLETKLTELFNENEILRAKIDMLARKFGPLNSQEDEQIQHDEITSTEKSTVLNILDQSPIQPHPTVIKTEHSTSLPVKWRLKSLNITSDP